jgi:hypothetical protein
VDAEALSSTTFLVVVLGSINGGAGVAVVVVVVIAMISRDATDAAKHDDCGQDATERGGDLRDCCASLSPAASVK